MPVIKTQCRGMHQQMVCKRMARYNITKSALHETTGIMFWDIYTTKGEAAFWCKIHAEEMARYHNNILREAYAKRKTL